MFTKVSYFLHIAHSITFPRSPAPLVVHGKALMRAPIWNYQRNAKQSVRDDTRLCFLTLQPAGEEVRLIR